MEYTKGEWESYKSPIGDWVIHSDGTLICREVRHFNKDLIAAAPRLYGYIKGRAEEGDNDAKCFLSVLGLE